jgi:dTDP-4-dehydrorhamnose 3,5-epimerase
MIFTETKLKGAYLIHPEKMEDERGFFARTFCREEFGRYGLNLRIAQCSISYNEQRGTLRGMHYQISPCQETKVVWCLRGSLYDVILDLRPDSPTYGQWASFQLLEDDLRMIYIPEGIAHGFQTLEDQTAVHYQISEFYHPECSRGVRWDDVAFHINWPMVPTTMSEKDRNFPDFVK